MTMINTQAVMCAVEALHAVGHKVEVGDAAVLPVDGQQLVMDTGLTDDQLRRAATRCEDAHVHLRGSLRYLKTP